MYLTWVTVPNWEKICSNNSLVIELERLPEVRQITCRTYQQKESWVLLEDSNWLRVPLLGKGTCRGNKHKHQQERLDTDKPRLWWKLVDDELVVQTLLLLAGTSLNRSWPSSRHYHLLGIETRVGHLGIYFGFTHGQLPKNSVSVWREAKWSIRAGIWLWIIHQWSEGCSLSTKRQRRAHWTVHFSRLAKVKDGSGWQTTIPSLDASEDMPSWEMPTKMLIVVISKNTTFKPLLSINTLQEWGCRRIETTRGRST